MRRYLEDYYPAANESQTKDALLTQSTKEIRIWYKKEFLKNFDLKEIQWNETSTWRKLNNLIYHFEKEFCEFSIIQQENKWKNLTPINSINEENVKEKIKDIEYLSTNLYYSYYARISKLIKIFSKFPTFINKCIVQLPQAPSKNPREDYNQQDKRNQKIYKELIQLIFDDLIKLEGTKINKETWKSLLIEPKTYKPRKTKVPTLNKLIDKPIRKNSYKRRSKSSKQSNNIETKITLEKDIENKNMEQIHNIINNVQRNKQDKFLNNPSFGGGVNYNKSLIIDNNLKGHYGFILIDSGSGSNLIGSNIDDKLNLKRFPIKTAIQSEETVMNIKEYCYLHIGIEHKKNQYYFLNVKLKIIPSTNNNKQNFYYDKIIIDDSTIVKMNNNKIYPLRFPYFMNYSENITELTNPIINRKKKVIDYDWDRKYLDKKGNIKVSDVSTSNNTPHNHNTEEITLSKQQLTKLTKHSDNNNNNPHLL